MTVLAAHLCQLQGLPLHSRFLLFGFVKVHVLLVEHHTSGTGPKARQMQTGGKLYLAQAACCGSV